MPCFWMSFCDTDKPNGEQFTGVVITISSDFESAVKKTHRLQINPGGEVASWEVPEDDIPMHFFNRLLSKEQCDELEEIMEK